ncbi:MAG: hypothetical protein HKO07_07050, partial [Pseudomonadales bacterium]|nr:hypothetical protein [Pseudomonadales bacterium]
TAVILLYNKIDLLDNDASQLTKFPLTTSTSTSDGKGTGTNTRISRQRYAVIGISALKDQGISLIADRLREMFAFESGNENTFTARQRHIDTLRNCETSLHNARRQLVQTGAAELFAEDLRKAQQQLGEITGRFSSDDLLGEIFSTFCIGK